MDEKPKTAGRGSRLLELMKTKAPGSKDESTVSGATSSAASHEEIAIPKVPLDTEGGKTIPTKTQGRGNLIAKMISHSQSSSEIPAQAQGVKRTEGSDAPRMGRGYFLAQLAKQSKLKPSDSSEGRSILGSSIIPSENICLPATDPEVSDFSICKKFEELSIENEKLPCVKRGEVGQKITVSTNYVTLMTDPGKGVFEFDVRFIPEIDFVAFRYKLIQQHFQSLKGIRCYDGGEKLYLPNKLSSDKLTLKGKHPQDDSPVNIAVTFKRQMRLKECSQLYNILFNNCAKVLKLTRLGRQYYDYRLGHEIPQHKLQVWPGYITSVEEFEGGIHLCCDIRHRVLRTETAYNILRNLALMDSSKFRELAIKELLGQCVLTRYNNNLYRIDDIDWDKTPLSTFKLSTGEEISFLEYYKKQYNLDITDVKQPLLINKPKTKKKEESSQLICLVPELCYMTGLTDKMRKDMKVMKEIAIYTRVSPAQRHLGLMGFLDNIRNNSTAKEMLQDWGLKLADKPVELDARVLPREDIILKNNTKIETPLNVEWSKFIRNHKVLRSVDIKHWILVHTYRDTNLANAFKNMLLKVGPGLGIDIYDPIMVPLRDDRIDSYIRGLKENISNNTQIAVCLCTTPREDRYSAIKKLCCKEVPVPSQVVNCGTISRENRMRSVVQNVALQMNNKLGGASWAVHVPLKNCMICGIDSYHDADKRGNSVGAFVASLDAEFTQWYSQTCIQEPKQELLDGLVFCFISALKKYLSVNNILPERIVIFRDGVSDGQFSIVQNHEIHQFLDACELLSKNYRPKFSFIVVQKRISTKFYKHLNPTNNELGNPAPGSVLDHTVTRRNFYDFFLVSQHVSCGTATPSHYVVLYDNSELKPDLMQRLTYKFCHLYYNWAGVIRVPAPCQYAHKLAYLVGQNIKGLPSELLEEKLYYL